MWLKSRTPPLLEHNRRFHELLTELKVPHEYEELPGIGHNPQQVYKKAGVAGWEFNEAFAAVIKANEKVRKKLISFL